MSKNKFCTNCGHKYEYNFAPPKFCSECGTSMSGAEGVAAENHTPKESDDGESASVPKINKLSAKVDFNSSVLSMDFDPNKGFAFKEKKFDKRNTSFDE